MTILEAGFDGAMSVLALPTGNDFEPPTAWNA
jgi:hypothetical protein